MPPSLELGVAVPPQFPLRDINPERAEPVLLSERLATVSFLGILNRFEKNLRKM